MRVRVCVAPSLCMREEYMCTHVCRVQRRTLGVLFYHSPLYSLEIGSLPELGASLAVSKCHQSSGHFPRAKVTLACV